MTPSITRRSLPLLLLCTLLCGCASEKKYKEKIDTWVGSHIDSLILAWGVPTKIHRVRDGSRIVEYARSKDYYRPERKETVTQVEKVPSFRPYSQPGVTYYDEKITTTTNVIPARSGTYWCTTLLDVNPQGIIVKTSFFGNSCISSD